jgi:hypothetical protein
VGVRTGVSRRLLLSRRETEACSVLFCHRWGPPGEQWPPPHFLYSEELSAADHPGGDHRGSGRVYLQCEQPAGDCSHYRHPPEGRWVDLVGGLHQASEAGQKTLSPFVR